MEPLNVTRFRRQRCRSTKRWRRFAGARQQRSHYLSTVVAEDSWQSSSKTCWVVCSAFSRTNLAVRMVMALWRADVCPRLANACLAGCYCLFEPFLVEAIVATLKMRRHGHVAHGTSWLYHSVLVSTLLGACGPWCVNPVETSTSWYNLYLHSLSYFKSLYALRWYSTHPVCVSAISCSIQNVIVNKALGFSLDLCTTHGFHQGGFFQEL